MIAPAGGVGPDHAGAGGQPRPEWGLRALLRRRGVAYPALAALVIIAFLAAALAGAVRRREEMNPDGLCYIRLAQYLVDGDLGASISGYWSPLLSWSMAPLVAAGMDGLLAARIVLALWGAVLLAAVYRFSRRFTTLSPLWTAIAMAGTGMGAIRWALYEITPDIIVGGLLIAYFSSVADRSMFRGRWRPLVCGLLGGLAYLGKAYALPFFLAHFTFTVALRSTLALRAGGGPARAEIRRGALVWAAGMLGFALVAGPWIGVLSWKYGRLTFSTAAGINHAKANTGSEFLPGPRPALAPQPPHFMLWETPEALPYRQWSPLGSMENARLQVDIFKRNLPVAGRILANFDAWGLGALAFFLGPVASLVLWRRRRWRFPGLWLTATVAIYLGGYALIFLNERFVQPALLPIVLLWSCQLALLAVAAVRERLPRVWLLRRLPAALVLAAVAWSFSARYGGDTWRRYYRIKAPPPVYRDAGEKLRAGGYPGPIACNRWREGMFIAFHMNAVFLDTGGSGLRERGVRTYLVWRGAQEPPSPPGESGWTLGTSIAAPRGARDIVVDVYVR